MDIVSVLINCAIFILVISLLVLAYLYEHRIHKLYEGIGSTHGWRYEKYTSEIPFSTVTQYGKLMKKDRARIATLVRRKAGPSIFGEANLRKFALVRFMEGSGRSQTSYTLIGARHKGINASAYISKEGILQKLGKAIGMQDIELNDPLFDPVFRIKGDYANIGAVLDISTRQKLINLISQYSWKYFGVLEINQKEVVFTKNKVIKNKDFLITMIDLVTCIANNVDKY